MISNKINDVVVPLILINSLMDHLPIGCIVSGQTYNEKSNHILFKDMRLLLVLLNNNNLASSTYNILPNEIP